MRQYYGFMAYAICMAYLKGMAMPLPTMLYVLFRVLNPSGLFKDKPK